MVSVYFTLILHSYEDNMTYHHGRDLLHVKTPVPEQPVEPKSCKQQAEGGKGVDSRPSNSVRLLARLGKHDDHLDLR